MKVVVFGLWHLGTVTAAGLAAAGHDVTGLDVDAVLVERLAGGAAPLFEPGLDDLVRAGLAGGRLDFTTDASVVSAADLVWLTSDTPVDDEDRADVEWVVQRAAVLFPHLRDGALVLVSSQVPVGTTRRLEQMFQSVAGGRRVGFACSPENLRLGTAIEAFTHPDRVVVGIRAAEDRATIETLLRPFTDRIEWMSVESAEMTKHAVNAFLAMSVTFINEIAVLCEQVGADASDVARGLKSEARIGPKAYLSPGAAFAGGTLARDIMFLSELGVEHDVATHVLAAVKASNDAHRQWAQRRLVDVLGGVGGRTVAVWGLTYKPGTDTLRRSSAVELCEWLHRSGARVRAHDPVIRQVPADLAASIHLSADPLGAAERADALVVSTPWPQYRDVAAGDVARRMSGTLVLDPARFLAASFEREPGLRYLSVGRPAAP
jgi:UDPglucose 6-dehydrogenase